MKKETIKGVSEREYILVPIAWLERLVKLAQEEGTVAQHLKGYIASAEVLVENGKRVDESTYYSL